MFYKMIRTKRDDWYNSPECTVKSIVDYILKEGHMRDAQVEAIKTWLFLKVAGNNKPLDELFSCGFFNNLNFEDIELKAGVKKYLDKNPSAAALFEYASLPDETGEPLSPKVVAEIKKNPSGINYSKVFRDAFYDVNYTDYLFSLPMGAGKTFLMAAFIYLDLYFADMEPNNKAFAHNFIIFAPSGLKTSVIPSLRTIQSFNPAWVIPEPVATTLKRKLIFEVLDQNKTKNKSNKTKNPNVQKIAMHQPFDNLFGLVAVTNAEKVIYELIEKENLQSNFFAALPINEQQQIMQSKELRDLLSKIPNLSVFIDEVHHASAAGDSKLRKVVERWSETRSLNSIVGFSGTPYLSGVEKIQITDNLEISSPAINNIVEYYPLANGIGNFLKKPIVKVTTSKNRLEIVEAGVREFFNCFKDTIYPDGTLAKLAIYCGTISVLEEQIYPLVERIVSEYLLNPSEAILKFHRGNPEHPIPVDSALQFASLDQPFSSVRIILLVQIGKEGWDCRSLTGVVLSQENDCDTNMVLQVSCRCLRQVQKGVLESALIYLNEFNAGILKMQLEKAHHISLKEFQDGNPQTTIIKRYDRTGHLNMPGIDFYQLKVNYKTIVEEDNLDPLLKIPMSTASAESQNLIKDAVMGDTLEFTNSSTAFTEKGEHPINFSSWLYDISKQSFTLLPLSTLNEYLAPLKIVFDKITYTKDDVVYFSSKFNVMQVNKNIRTAFYKKRSFETYEELIPEKASLLQVANFKSEVETKNKDSFFPAQTVAENIIAADEGKLKADPKTEEAIKLLLETGNLQMAEQLREKTLGSIHLYNGKDRSFHYLPYKTDSVFEITFLDELLKLELLKTLNLEIYYNGDRALTEFKIKCYKKNENKWLYLGMYTPDFLIINRKSGKIHKAIIVETKGDIYKNDPEFKAKKEYMQTAFKSKNNEAFGYDRFEYLYLEDNMDETDIIITTANNIKKFFQDS